MRTSVDVNRLDGVMGHYAARCPGLPPPEEAESFAVPTDQGVRLHDRERGCPIDQVCEHDEGVPRRLIGTAGFDSALSIERQLLPEKQILSGQLGPRSEAERRQPEGINQ